MYDKAHKRAWRLPSTAPDRACLEKLEQQFASGSEGFGSTPDFAYSAASAAMIGLSPPAHFVAGAAAPGPDQAARQERETGAPRPERIGRRSWLPPPSGGDYKHLRRPNGGLVPREFVMMHETFTVDLTPEKIEVLRIERANNRNNQVETTMRLRALAEISELLDTEALLSLSESVTSSAEHGAEGRR